MKCLVTGAAGFIGSTLVEALLRRGDQVIGLDAFTDYYPRFFKERNQAEFRNQSGCVLVETDLVTADLGPWLEGVQVVFHLAAQPGVRASWGDGFHHYTQNNVLGTQRLFEAAVRAGVGRVVYASSSSVYGDSEALPTFETAVLRPISPYGVTKAATEHLGYLYFRNHGLATVGLRYFTVYGPRQRPDMAFHRFIKAGLKDEPIDLFGDGLQSRDFTFVGDAAAATLGAAEGGKPGTVYNVGGGAQVVLKDAMDLIGRLVGRPLQVRSHPQAKGDVRHTSSDTTRARNDFGYHPQTGFEAGLAAEAAWMKALLETMAA
jgi:UDP-glucose 4-epimerase